MRLYKGDRLYISENSYLKLLEDARDKWAKWNAKAEFHAEDGSVHKVFLKYTYCTDKDGLELLMKESKFQMYYPHIAVVYGSLKAKDADGEEIFCVLMEYVEGESLQEYRQKMENVAEDEMFSQMMQLLYGVQYYMKYVSGDRYVHRDLKPANIMITWKDGKVVIVDFDWAHIHGSSATMRAGKRGYAIGGTAGYADPRAYSTSKTDVQMDIYALGRIFCFWLTGDHYFSMEERYPGVYQMLEEEILYGLDYNRIPKRFHAEKYRFFTDVIIRKMVAPYEERYTDIDHVIADMTAFIKTFYADSSKAQAVLGNDHVLDSRTADAKDRHELMVRVQFEKEKIVQNYFMENYSVRELKWKDRLLMAIYNVNGRLHYMIYNSQLKEAEDEDCFCLGDETIRIQQSGEKDEKRKQKIQ